MRKAAPGGSRSQNSQEVGDSSLQETSCSARLLCPELRALILPSPAQERSENVKSPREGEKLKAKDCECQIPLKKVSFPSPHLKQQSTCDLWRGGCCCLKIKPKTQRVWRPAVKNLLCFPCSMSHLGFSRSELVIIGIPTKMTRILFLFFSPVRFIISLISTTFVLWSSPRSWTRTGSHCAKYCTNI